ncbi:MAG: branched-chain amino acid ABC transporter permease, partial [Candidatus Hydrogenedens sp.]
VSLVVSIAVVLQIIISAIIGGRRTIIGPILGAFFIILLREWLQPLGQLSYVVVSIMGLIVLLFLPDGIISLFLRKN